MRRAFAEDYASLEQWHWWFRGRQRILESVLRRELPPGRPASIASLGCGPATGLRWLEPFATPTGRLIGIDVDALHAPAPDTHIRYVVGRLEAVPLASRAFDLVLVLDVLEHLDDDLTGLREAARLAKPGGLVVVTVPALPSLWGRQDLVSHHRRRYTRRSLRHRFAQAALPPPRLTYFNTFLFPPVAAVRWARRAFGTAGHLRSDFDNARRGLANDVLTAVFAAEHRLVGRIPLPFGASLLAVLRIARPAGQDRLARGLG